MWIIVRSPLQMSCSAILQHILRFFAEKWCSLYSSHPALWCLGLGGTQWIGAGILQIRHLDKGENNRMVPRPLQMCFDSS